MTLLKSNKDAVPKGAKAPNFSLLNVDGNTISLSAFKGKPVLIIFMCNHCPYVIPKMDEIKEIQDEFPDLVVLPISSNDPNYTEEDSFENMQILAKEKGYKYYLFDETQETAKAYGAVCTPDPYLFDKGHKNQTNPRRQRPAVRAEGGKRP